jgi:hypothetical protein
MNFQNTKEHYVMNSYQLPQMLVSYLIDLIGYLS